MRKLHRGQRIRRVCSWLIYCYLLTVTGWTQSTGSDARKKSFNKGTVGTQTLSPYIRETGLLYIENVERARKLSQLTEEHSDAAFESATMLNDHIEMHATRPADKEFFGFLTLLESMAEGESSLFHLRMRVASGGGKDTLKQSDEAALEKYIVCRNGLRDFIKAGKYSGHKALAEVCLVGED